MLRLCSDRLRLLKDSILIFKFYFIRRIRARTPIIPISFIGTNWNKRVLKIVQDIRKRYSCHQRITLSRFISLIVVLFVATFCLFSTGYPHYKEGGVGHTRWTSFRVLVFVSFKNPLETATAICWMWDHPPCVLWAGYEIFASYMFIIDSFPLNVFSIIRGVKNLISSWRSMMYRTSFINDENIPFIQRGCWTRNGGGTVSSSLSLSQSNYLNRLHYNSLIDNVFVCFPSTALPAYPRSIADQSATTGTRGNMGRVDFVDAVFADVRRRSVNSESTLSHTSYKVFNYLFLSLSDGVFNLQLLRTLFCIFWNDVFPHLILGRIGEADVRCFHCDV